MKNKGSILVLLGAIAFSLGGLLIKLIPLDPFTINTFRCIFSSLVIGLYMKLTHHKLVINKTVIIGTIFVVLMMMGYVFSNKLTTAANAIVLEYTAPILVIIFETILFNRKPDKASIVICILVILGIAIMMMDGLSTGNLLGDLIALSSGVFYALVMMLNEFDDSDSLSSVFLGHLFTGLLSIFIYQNVISSGINTIMLLVALGIFQAGLGYTFLMVGLKHCDPVTGSLIACIEPVLNPILVAIFYGEYMNTTQIIGCVVVIGSIVVYNILASRTNQYHEDI